MAQVQYLAAYAFQQPAIPVDIKTEGPYATEAMADAEAKTLLSQYGQFFQIPGGEGEIFKRPFHSLAEFTAAAKKQMSNPLQQYFFVGVIIQ